MKYYQKKWKGKSSKYVLPSDRTLNILKIGVGTHNWIYVRKKDFHVSYTWYKSLLQRVPVLNKFWDLEKTVLHEICVSGTVVSPY